MGLPIHKVEVLLKSIVLLPVKAIEVEELKTLNLLFAEKKQCFKCGPYLLE